MGYARATVGRNVLTDRGGEFFLREQHTAAMNLKVDRHQACVRVLRYFARTVSFDTTQHNSNFFFLTLTINTVVRGS